MVRYTDPSLSSLGRIRNLVEVDFSLNAAVNKVMVDELATNCQSLVRLNLMCCQGKPFIDDTSMARLSVMKNLKYLNLSYTCSLTDVGLALIARISSLEELELAGIAQDRITSTGALALVVNLHKLTDLNLAGNHGIGTEILDPLDAIGLTRPTFLTVNLCKTGITIEELSEHLSLGNIFLSLQRGYNVKYRYDRATFFVGMADFDDDYDPFAFDDGYGFDFVNDGFDEYADAVDFDYPIEVAGNWSGEIIVQPAVSYSDDDEW